MKSFINSQFLVSLITLFVGLFAVVLYWHQKKDEKRNAARVILAELRHDRGQACKHASLQA